MHTLAEQLGLIVINIEFSCKVMMLWLTSFHNFECALFCFRGNICYQFCF
ncbi:unnamed protein product [Musa acuminata subsp. malaccensis]|uniref:(wild Malaysian banana) hypothetical protein n=1 Tax=Musa acuminata subsp. malaccensis TaxID=214687 RepID=A0A804I8M3_MUSAM|nr:unnamed protein product [Musa acuminata subsp. malaccensis]